MRFRRFVDDARDHEEGSGVVVGCAQFFQGVDEDVLLSQEVRYVHDLYLSDGKGNVAVREFLHVVFGDLFRREVGNVGTGF